MTVDYSKADGMVYKDELKDFLPDNIFDVHVHLFDRSCLIKGAEFPLKSCYQKFGGFFTLTDYRQWADALLPGHNVYLNSFGKPSHLSDLDASARYSGVISDNRRFYAMALVSPHDTIEDVTERVETNQLIGYKPYLNFVDWKEKSNVTIDDMLPSHLMQTADQKGLAVMLHIPRHCRLADPVNQQQMVRLCRDWPKTSFIFAHIGRAYYLKNVVGFLNGIAACPNAYIDTAMVNHEGVLEYAFNQFSRERILFGSDAPIAFLRGKSVEINNQYAYLMGEDYEIGTSIHDSDGAVDFTFFFYEQLRGIKLAAQRAGMTSEDIQKVFFDNAYRLFRRIAQDNYGGKDEKF